jgi:hypothetical protein
MALCEVCYDPSRDACPRCSKVFCQDCVNSYDRSLLEDGKYPKCGNLDCDFIHTYSIVLEDLRELLVVRTIEIEATKMDSVREIIEKNKLVEKRKLEIEREKQDLLAKLPKSLSLLGEKFIDTSSRKKRAAKEIVGSTVEFIKACPYDFCSGMIKADFICSKCDLALCSKCEEHLTVDHKCDPQIVEDIRYIIESSKPCPVCKIRITKSAGCDHMYCPVSKTHFSYETGKIFPYKFSHPEETRAASEGCQYQMKTGLSGLTESEKAFLIWGEIKFKKIPSRLEQLKTDFLLGSLDLRFYKAKIAHVFETEYIHNLNREWFSAMRKKIYEKTEIFSQAKSDPKLKIWFEYISDKYPGIKLKKF